LPLPVPPRNNVGGTDFERAVADDRVAGVGVAGQIHRDAVGAGLGQTGAPGEVAAAGEGIAYRSIADDHTVRIDIRVERHHSAAEVIEGHCVPFQVGCRRSADHPVRAGGNVPQVGSNAAGAGPDDARANLGDYRIQRRSADAVGQRGHDAPRGDEVGIEESCSRNGAAVMHQRNHADAEGTGDGQRVAARQSQGAAGQQRHRGAAAGQGQAQGGPIPIRLAECQTANNIRGRPHLGEAKHGPVVDGHVSGQLGGCGHQEAAAVDECRAAVSANAV